MLFIGTSGGGGPTTGGIGREAIGDVGWIFGGIGGGEAGGAGTGPQLLLFPQGPLSLQGHPGEHLIQIWPGGHDVGSSGGIVVFRIRVGAGPGKLQELPG